jgi:hypothetical protein
MRTEPQLEASLMATCLTFDEQLIKYCLKFLSRDCRQCALDDTATA